MRTARALLLLFLAALSLSPLAGCRELIRESFQAPKARLIDVEPGGDGPVLSNGCVRLVLVFQVTNPNAYSLALSRIAYSGHLGTVRIAQGEHPEEMVLEGQKGVLVRAPLEIRLSAFRDALLKTIAKRAVDYEFNGCLGVRTPFLGVVQVPFSVAGQLDAANLLRAAGVSPY
jgi:LEA14-like dessication related protein